MKCICNNMKFSRVSLIVILYGHDTRSLTFENFSQPSNKLNAKECHGCSRPLLACCDEGRRCQGGRSDRWRSLTDSSLRRRMRKTRSRWIENVASWQAVMRGGGEGAGG